MIDLGPELPGGEFTFDSANKITTSLRTNPTRALFETLRVPRADGLTTNITQAGRAATEAMEARKTDKNNLALTFKQAGSLALVAFTQSDVEEELQQAVLCQLSGAPGSFLDTYSRHKKLLDPATSETERDLLFVDSVAMVTSNHPEINESLQATSAYFHVYRGKIIHGEFARNGFAYTAHLLDVATGHLQGIEVPEETLPELDLDTVYKFLNES